MQLHKLSLEDTRHRGKSIYFTVDGEVLYGRNEDDLCYPHVFEMMGKFPPISLADLKEAFLLGVRVGRMEEKIERESVRQKAPFFPV